MWFFSFYWQQKMSSALWSHQNNWVNSFELFEVWIETEEKQAIWKSDKSRFDEHHEKRWKEKRETHMWAHIVTYMR